MHLRAWRRSKLQADASFPVRKTVDVVLLVTMCVVELNRLMTRKRDGIPANRNDGDIEVEPEMGRACGGGGVGGVEGEDSGKVLDEKWNFDFRLGGGVS
jgi:hypothetical protein